MKDEQAALDAQEVGEGGQAAEEVEGHVMFEVKTLLFLIILGRLGRFHFLQSL